MNQHSELSVYIFIAINFFIFVSAVWQKYIFISGAKEEIFRVLRNLKSREFEERGSVEIQKHARGAFKNSQVLSPLWAQFEESLIETDPKQVGSIYAAVASDNIFNVDNLLHLSKSFVSHSIFGAVPQILTSVGIIGTFFTIIQKLGQNGQGEKINDFFITSLVGSLSSAFYSSLFGISFAVVFLSVEKFTMKGLADGLQEINFWFEGKFKVLSPERILFEQKTILSGLKEEIANAITESVQDISASMGSALTDALDEETKETIKRGVKSFLIKCSTPSFCKRMRD